MRPYIRRSFCTSHRLGMINERRMLGPRYLLRFKLHLTHRGKTPDRMLGLDPASQLSRDSAFWESMKDHSSPLAGIAFLPSAGTPWDACSDRKADELALPFHAFRASLAPISSKACGCRPMPNKEYALTMARYNLWQNESLTKAASTLSYDDRQANRGAFFGSIQQTFSHVLWGDQVWMSRFAGTKAPEGGIPESAELVQDWDEFRAARAQFDKVILDWAHNVELEWFEGDLSWFSGALGRDITKPKTTLVIQLFNHQTHHRGQIHAMLTAAGAKPGDTDVPFMPEPFQEM